MCGGWAAATVRGQWSRLGLVVQTAATASRARNCGVWEVQGSVLDESKTFLNIRSILSARVHALRGGRSPCCLMPGERHRKQRAAYKMRMWLSPDSSRGWSRHLRCSCRFQLVDGFILHSRPSVIACQACRHSSHENHHLV